MGVDPVSVLMVDDRQENLVAMEAVLSRPDRRLLTATSGNDALRLLLRNDIAVALPPGTDPEPYVKAGATWWMPEFPPESRCSTAP